MKIKNKFLALKHILGPKYKKSYSQQGEDLVIAKLLKTIGVQKPFYIDIGANHPVDLSNTYLFYKRGGSGILIEPDHTLCEKIKSKRPRDICIEAGIGAERGKKTFFEFTDDDLGTFSEKDALECQKRGCVLKGTREIEMVTFEDVIKKYNVTKIDVLSIDVEGWDLEILKKINFDEIRPAIICTETKKYNENIPETDTPTSTFLKNKGYILVYSLVNSIFVDPVWKNK